MLKIVELAKNYLGTTENTTAFRDIIDTYNSYSPLPQGYKMKYTDPWCATFISFLAIRCGLTDIIPVECGCERQINLFKNLGEWVEDDAYTPSEGDIIYYDWQDTGDGDATGWADHVGIVESCDGRTITVIEGNKSESVSRRILMVNAKYIRGFGVPKYNADAKYSGDSQKVEVPPIANPDNNTAQYTTREEVKVTVELIQLSKGSKGQQVKTLQVLLNGKGAYLSVDGDFGKLTDQAVRTYQRTHGLEVDGIVGKNTWTSLLTA